MSVINNISTAPQIVVEQYEEVEDVNISIEFGELLETAETIKEPFELKDRVEFLLNDADEKIN